MQRSGDEDVTPVCSLTSSPGPLKHGDEAIWSYNWWLFRFIKSRNNLCQSLHISVSLQLIHYPVTVGRHRDGSDNYGAHKRQPDNTGQYATTPITGSFWIRVGTNLHSFTTNCVHLCHCQGTLPAFKLCCIVQDVHAQRVWTHNHSTWYTIYGMQGGPNKVISTWWANVSVCESSPRLYTLGQN